MRVLTFLVADTQLYKRLCPSVGPLVRPSFGPLIRPSVMIGSKSGKTSVLDTFCVFVCGGGWGGVELGCGWGLDAPAQPSATILWPRVTCSLMSRLRSSLFGGPSNFQQSQLPTYEQVGKQFLQTKNELKAKSPQIWN